VVEELERRLQLTISFFIRLLDLVEAKGVVAMVESLQRQFEDSLEEHLRVFAEQLDEMKRVSLLEHEDGLRLKKQCGSLVEKLESSQATERASSTAMHLAEERRDAAERRCVTLQVKVEGLQSLTKHLQTEIESLTGVKSELSQLGNAHSETVRCLEEERDQLEEQLRVERRQHDASQLSFHETHEDLKQDFLKMQASLQQQLQESQRQSAMTIKKQQYELNEQSFRIMELEQRLKARQQRAPPDTSRPLPPHE